MVSKRQAPLKSGAFLVFGGKNAASRLAGATVSAPASRPQFRNFLTVSRKCGTEIGLAM